MSRSVEGPRGSAAKPWVMVGQATGGLRRHARHPRGSRLLMGAVAALTLVGAGQGLGCELIAGVEEGVLAEVTATGGAGVGGAVAGAGGAGAVGGAGGSGASAGSSSTGGAAGAGATGGSGGAGGAPPSYFEEVMADGPMGYWRLGEETTPTAYDSSGNGHDCTYQVVQVGAAGAIAGDDDTAASFDGDGGIDCGNLFGFEGRVPFSVELWVNPARIDASFVGKATWDQANGFTGWLMYYNVGEVTIRRVQMVSGPELVQGVYTYLAVTYDGYTLSLYVNGQLVGSRAVALDVVTHSDSFSIGRTTNWQPFEGLIDEVAVYDYNLSAARVLAHYEVGAGRR